MRIFLLCLAALALSTSGCKKQPSPNVFLDPALIPLIPRDTVAIAGVRMEQLRATPFYDRFVAQRQVAFFENVKKKTGVELGKLWEILAATDGKEPVLLLRGKFSEMGLEPKVAIEGAQRFSYKGYTLLGSEEGAITFLNPTTAMAGNTRLLRQIIDNRNEGGGLPQALSQRIEAIPASNQIWFAANVAGRIPALTDGDGGMASTFLQLAQAVEVVSGGINLQRGFRMKANASSRSDADARRLRDAVRAGVGFARLNTREDASELLDLYDGIQVTHQARQVELSVDVKPEQMERVIQFTSRLPGMR